MPRCRKSETKGETYLRSAVSGIVSPNEKVRYHKSRTQKFLGDLEINTLVERNAIWSTEQEKSFNNDLDQ